ncbi:DUF6286 domain-containing protein [Streptomyces sp. SID8352]|uniref:DUF6286 domain-containing protein n=1 Tax=Streptomyces sp. SID8352 TaxID=2690338 RepID=UPI0013714CB8|nr:hypothetical protein [Streptomyces sp. SID8352]
MNDPRHSEDGTEGTHPGTAEGSTRGPALEKSGTDPRTAGPPTAEPPAAGNGGRARRFWSARRVPAVLVAVPLLVVSGAFLYDVAAVRAGRDALGWRRELARQLDQRPLDDIWVRVGAAVAAALGLWLLLTALTPGLRRLLPMRRDDADVRAGLDRDAAALVLRDRAMETAGVRSVRVRVRRRAARVRARSHFRELDEVRADLGEVLDDAVRGLGLARPPAVSLRVKRPGRKG